MTCSFDSRWKAQSAAASSAFASTPGGSERSSIRSPSGQGVVAGSPGGGGIRISGRLAMSAKVWSGAITTHPTPSRNAARITGTGPPGAPIATARRARSTT